MSSSAVPEAARAGFEPALWWLAAMLFLLSADLLFLNVGGAKIKYGYGLVVATWLFRPAAMLAVLKDGLQRVPRWVLLPLLPLAVSVATSSAPGSSVAWTLWLGFDVFTVATVYAFLETQSFTDDDVRRSAALALGAIALMGLVQFVAIYVFNAVWFEPQLHLGFYRINGVSGWPHFLDIFAFLLLPIVLVQRRLGWAVRVLLAALVFVLVQSTAKTGWVLFVALAVLLLALDPHVFRTGFLSFLLPVAVVALIVPTPAFVADAPAVPAAEKIERFSADLDLGSPTTSGTDRVLISVMGLKVFAKHPWFGVGPRAYDTYVRTRFDAELPGENKLDANRRVNTKNENIWIEFLAECGLLFTLALAAVIVRALWVPRWAFANRLHCGAWIALVLYFAISGQVSQNGLLTMVYAVFGIFLYARELAAPDFAPPGAPAARRKPAAIVSSASGDNQRTTQTHRGA